MITHVEAYNLKNASHGIHSGVTVRPGKIQGEVVDLKSPVAHYSLIGQLQKALNDDNVIGLKSVIRAIIWDYEAQQLSLKNQTQFVRTDNSTHHKLAEQIRLMQERKLQLIDVLYDLETFHNYYKKRSLRSHIGSGSTGQAEHQYGMGLVVLDTLTKRARKAFQQTRGCKDGSLIPAFLTFSLTKDWWVLAYFCAFI